MLATGFRLTGTVMEMEQFGDNVTVAEGEQIHQGWLAHWRSAMDNDRLARLLAKVDPLLQQGKAVLVGFLISTRDPAAQASWPTPMPTPPRLSTARRCRISARIRRSAI